MARRMLVMLSLVAVSSAQLCSNRPQSQCAGDCRWNGFGCTEICFRANTAYTPDMNNQPVTSLSSQEFCKEHCRNVGGCAHFTYYASTKSCHLQGATASRQAAAAAVSGEPHCNDQASWTTPPPQTTPWHWTTRP